MYLVREVLDKELVDRDGEKAGKVNGLVIELPDDGFPEVVSLLTGPTTLTAHLPDWLAGLTLWIRTSVLGLDRTEPIEICWEHVEKINVDLQIDLDRRDDNLVLSDETIWERWIEPLPFSER